MKQPVILTVILNYKTPDLTVAAADAALCAMEGLDGEIVIVDNDSRDESFDVLTETALAKNWADRGLRVVQSGRNGGYGAGNNFGMRVGLSDGRHPDFVYILNSDAQPEPDAIRVLLDHMQVHGACGIAGSYIYGPSEGWHCTCFRFPSIASEFEDAARVGVVSRLLSRHRVPLDLPSKPTVVDWVAGASVLMRCEMLETIGSFDEGFFLYFEETDLCRRASLDGWTVDYIPSSRVAHLGGASTGSKIWQRVPDYWFKSRNRYFTKARGATYATAATAARVAGLLVWRLKCFVTGRQRIDPPYVLRDLVRHALPHRRPIARTIKRRQA